MYKNQLQELAQRSCFNLPSYTCLREGPDHAPRFKATVNFNGEIFESPNFCTTLRQAEHTAAEVALSSLSNKGPSQSLAARILDETGVYKNLLQEISQRVGASLPVYTTFRSGRGHLPVFTCIVELAGIAYTGEPAKNKKQAEKNAAMAAWSSLKQLVQQSERSSSEWVNNDEQEHITIARALRNYHVKAKMANLSFPVKFPMQNSRPSSTQPPSLTASKILPLIFSDTLPQSSRPIGPAMKDCPTPPLPYNHVPNFRAYQGIAPQVTIRNAIPVFSAQSLQQLPRTPPSATTPRVNVRQAVPVCAASPVRLEEPLAFKVGSGPPASSLARMEETETGVIHEMKELKI